MNGLQAYHNFLRSFSIPAYDENSVPDNAMASSNNHYITYECNFGEFGHSVGQVITIWYRDTSWSAITSKMYEILNAITRGGKQVLYDGGSFWIRSADPKAQRISDETDDQVRGYILNVEVEFLE